MKRKPRINFSDHGEWCIELPGYGFAKPRVLGPFSSQREAFQHLVKFRMFSASATMQIAREPGDDGPYYTRHKSYPMKITG